MFLLAETPIGVNTADDSTRHIEALVPCIEANRLWVTEGIAPIVSNMIDEQLQLIVEFASLAPSVHNTQPWRFVANQHSLEVWADTTRQLGFLDCGARQLHISCGAAIEFARLAVRSLGYDCVVRLLPSPEQPNHLATLALGGRRAPTEREQRLIAAAPRRYTDRGPYDDGRVSPSVLARLTDAVTEVGCWMRDLTRPGERLLAAALLEKVEEIEAADPHYRQELARWSRSSPASDGLPPAAHPEWPTTRVSDVPLRDFAGAARHVHPGDVAEAPSVERDTLVLLGSDTDDRLGWLRTGRAVASLLLVVTDAGLSSQPLGPATDLPAARAQLQHGLGLLGHPQLMFRVGRGHGRPVTRRRPVAETLTIQPVA